VSKIYLDQFGPYNYAYLKKEATRDDLEVRPEDLMNCSLVDIEPQIKHYLV
jgi:hypothetical protein